MRTRDERLMWEAYNKSNLTKTIKESLDNEYETEVDLNLNYSRNGGHSLDDYGIKVRVKYTLDLDFRSYGLKDIHVFNVKIEPFEIPFEEEAGQSPIRISIEDTQNLRIDTGSDRTITLPFFPYELELTLDENFKPIVEKSSLVFNQSSGY